MADDAKEEPTKEAEATADANAEGEPEEKKSGGMMKILLLVGVPVILIAVIACVLFFTEFGQNLLGKEAEAETAEAAEAKEVEMIDPTTLVFYDIPELMVNLKTKRNHTSFLRLTLKLELGDPNGVAQLDLIQPRIIHSFQMYLRDLSLEDLQGSVGTQRVREELLRRANAQAESVQTKVKNVLIQTFVVQ